MATSVPESGAGTFITIVVANVCTTLLTKGEWAVVLKESIGFSVVPSGDVKDTANKTCDVSHRLKTRLHV